MIREKKKVLEKYEEPLIEIIEFELEDSIALSGDFGSSTICGEGCFNLKKVYLFALCLLLTLIFSATFLNVTVKADEYQQPVETVTVTVTSYFDSENHPSSVIDDQNYGSRLSVETTLAEDSDYAFAYWVVNGVVYADLPVDHEFVLLYDLELLAVFHPITPTLEYAVLFMDSNGDKLDLQYIESGNSATPPSSELPDKPGYVVNVTTPWSVDTSSITSNTVSVLQYTLDTATTYTLSVTDGTVGGETSDTFAFNEVVTVVADTPGASMYFHHWEIEDRTVSYQSTYSFTMLENVTIEAVYDSEAPSDVPTVTLSDNLSLRDGYNSYLGQFYLPTGYELIEVGVVSSASTDFLDLNSSSGLRKPMETYNGATKEFLISITDTDAVSVRAYLIYEHSSTLTTIYDQPAYQVLNGDFETGDLSGWNSYRIWKDESGMDAFIDDRVVDGTYFGGSYPYDRDGTYNLGIVGGSLSWDQSSERMGHLRSSDFILGGSGWISFKLGGGKTTSTAYVSVRKTTDNTEVARFGNRHFNDTGVATTQYGSTIDNAEAFMFQYYFDLGSIADMGDSYYFVITEASAYDWCILSADSFDTFYETAVTPSADQLATNIAPSILGVGSATNAIVDGYFDSDFTYWQNVDSSWYINSGQARSNPSGDSDLGVIRSSAFTIDGTDQYLRFDWAGGLKYDKQIFVSIKEVGTNIEVLRYVRRDNQSGKESESFDNHMLDLSGLDTSKEYYVEFCDNRTGSWGIQYVDAIRLVDVDEWNAVTSGDRAVSVTPLQLEFIYVKNY